MSEASAFLNKLYYFWAAVGGEIKLVKQNHATQWSSPECSHFTLTELKDTGAAPLFKAFVSFLLLIILPFFFLTIHSAAFPVLFCIFLSRVGSLLWWYICFHYCKDKVAGCRQVCCVCMGQEVCGGHKSWTLLSVLCTWFRMSLNKVDMGEESVMEKGENTVMSFIFVSLFHISQAPYPLHSEVFCGWVLLVGCCWKTFLEIVQSKVLPKK